MNDPNWETIQGVVANEIEVLNATNQLNVLSGLIKFLLAHKGPSGAGKAPMPDETALCHLHHAGTLFLLSDAGSYRNIAVHVGDGNGNVVHTPPDWQHVPRLMAFFFRQLSSVWTSGDALDAAAYSLWCINHIHPFKNGNGRTARAFSYACLSLKLGAELPGAPTVIDLIMQERARYEAVLRAADTNPATPNLVPMRQFLNELLIRQITSVP